MTDVTSSAEGKTKGRLRGMKVHVVYDPKIHDFLTDKPQLITVTDANVNDRRSGAR